MTSADLERARDRIHALRGRLSDTCCLLDTIGRNAQAQDNETRNNMLNAIRSIYAVSDDLATVCGDHLSGLANGSRQQPTEEPRILPRKRRVR